MFGSTFWEWPLSCLLVASLACAVSACLSEPWPSAPSPVSRCGNEAACIAVPPVDGSVMVLQPEEPKISLSGVHHFARAASEFESSEGVFLFPELRIISTITREVEPDGEGDEDPTGNSPFAWDGHLALACSWVAERALCCGPHPGPPLGQFGRFECLDASEV